MMTDRQILTIALDRCPWCHEDVKNVCERHAPLFLAVWQRWSQSPPAERLA